MPARVPWTLEWHRFTPAFCHDVDACLERLAGVDPLDEDGPDKPLRPVTLKWRRFQIRMAASSLVAAGVPVEAIQSLEDVVRPEPFRRLIRNLVARYGGKTANIYGLATALKSIARHHCKLDDDEVDALRSICRRVLVKQRGLSPKNRDRLRPFTDPATRDRLLLLPQQLMREASRAKDPDRRDAMTAQMAVALEIGQMAPLRAANLVSLEIGRNPDLRRQGPAGICRHRRARGGGEERDRARIPAAAREHGADQALHHHVPAQARAAGRQAPVPQPSGRRQAAHHLGQPDRGGGPGSHRAIASTCTCCGTSRP